MRGFFVCRNLLKELLIFCYFYSTTKPTVVKKFYSFLFLFLPISIIAQTDDKLFIADMLTIAENFSQPAANAAGYQASAGWFSSASTLEKWDFRVSLHGNALFVPSDKKTFSLSNANLKLLEIEGAESAELPTAFGGKTEFRFVGNINYLGQDIPVDFNAIDGIGRDYVPHAFLQAAVGVSAGTEITVRAMPQITIDGVTASTYGVGVKHNLSQYFGYNYAEDFQLALGVSYSMLNVQYEYEPVEVEGLLVLDMITVDANLFMAEVIGSKRWNSFELFGAAGAMTSAFKYEMGGNGILLPQVNTEVDRIEDSTAQFKGDVGFNFYYDRFRFSAMGTFGEFFNANLGLHVSI